MCVTQVRMGTGSCLLEYFMLLVIWPGSFEEPICLLQSDSFVLEVSSWSESNAFKYGLSSSSEYLILSNLEFIFELFCLRQKRIRTELAHFKGLFENVCFTYTSLMSVLLLMNQCYFSIIYILRYLFIV